MSSNKESFGKRMNRREFLKKGGAMAGAAVVLSSGLTRPLFAGKKEEAGTTVETFKVVGANPMERALNSAKQLAKNYPGAELKVMVPTGSLGNMTPFGPQWEE